MTEFDYLVVGGTAGCIVAARLVDPAVPQERGKQAWSTGHPVPGVIEVLKPPEVAQICDQVREHRC